MCKTPGVHVVFVQPSECATILMCKYPHVHIAEWAKLRVLLSGVQVSDVLFSYLREWDSVLPHSDLWEK